MSTSTLRAVVLAGERRSGDPVARARNAPAKAVAAVGGRAMALRVLDALEAGGIGGEIILCGPERAALESCPELLQRVAAGEVHWIAPGASPSLSAAAALEALPADAPVLITTADHALLTQEMVRTFAAGATDTGADAVVGLVRYESVSSAYPDTRRTVIRFRDGGCCGCNLYALSPRGRELVTLWRKVEESRKQPWRVLGGLLGAGAMLDYALGRLTLAEALKRLSEKLQLRADAVLLPFPEAAIDVDSEADLALAERILAARN